MNFFKLYIGDYQRDTAHLSITEHGAYMLMLQHYYATERPLPVGKALHRMLRAQDKAERDAIDTVAAQFWTTTEAGLVNGRADEEITKAGHQADTNARIAREREERRKAERLLHEQSTNRATNDQPNHSHSQTKENPPTPRGGEPEGFAEFWQRYPRKTAKPRAIKAFRAAKLNGQLPALMADLDARIGGEWLGKDLQYIPHPATYLNDRRWEDAEGPAQRRETFV